jgi:PKD repeat protein
MSVTPGAAASVDNGNGQVAGSLTLGAVPDHAAVWVAIARNTPNNVVTLVTDNAVPPNSYAQQEFLPNGGSPPEIELWVADDVVGAASLVISWTASGGSATSVAALAVTGQATPSLRALGAGGTQTASGGVDTLADAVVTGDAGDLVLLLVGFNAAGATETYTPAASSAVQAGSSGSGTNSSVALFSQMFGTAGSQTIQGGAQTDTAAGDTWVFFAAAVAAASGPPPVTATASAVPLSGTAPLPVAFTGGASGGTGPYTYAWVFGDGGTSAAQSPSHTYLTAGVYTARLTATDSLGATGTSSPVTITVSVLVAASGSPLSGLAPLTVNFTASPSGGTGPYTYAWVFGDGGTSTAQNPSHAYATPGTFTAYVTVTDALSNTGVAPNIVVTANPPLSVAASGSPLVGTPPLTVAFTATGSGGTGPYTYAWVFGDGGTSAAQNPSHTYAAQGAYVAQVTVTDATSATAFATVPAAVYSPALSPRVAQSVHAAQNGVYPLNLDLPSMTVAAGSNVVLAIEWWSTADLDPIITDSQGNVYMPQVAHELGPNHQLLMVAVAFDVAAGPTVINISATPAGSPAYTLLATAVEVSGSIPGADMVVTAPSSSPYSVTGTTGANSDLLLGFFAENGVTGTAYSGTPPNTLVDLVSYEYVPGSTYYLSLVSQVAGAAGAYTVAPTVVPPNALPAVLIAFSPPAPQHALSVGNSVQQLSPSALTFDLPPLTVSDKSGVAVFVCWPRGNPGVLASVTGLPMQYWEATGGIAHNAVAIFTVDQVPAGVYTLRVTFTSAPTAAWAAAVEVRSTYSDGAGFDSLGTAATGIFGPTFANGAYIQAGTTGAAASTDDLVLIGVSADAPAADGPLPSTGHATTTPNPGQDSDGFVVQSSPSSTPSVYAVLQAFPYTTAPVAATVGREGGADTTVFSVAFMGIGSPDPFTVTASGVPASGPAPLTVAFASQAAGGGPPYGYVWSFGDGGTSVVQNPGHTYAAPGSYTATVTASDSLLNTASATVPTVVTGGPVTVRGPRPWCHPASAPFRIPAFQVRGFSPSQLAYLSHATPIRDTLSHDYTTQPGPCSVATLFLQMLATEVPPVVAYGIWLESSLDQDVTVQPLGNVVYDQTQPDFLLGSPVTVAAGAVGWVFHSFDEVPVEFLAVSVQASVAPASGVFNAVLAVYQKQG